LARSSTFVGSVRGRPVGRSAMLDRTNVSRGSAGQQTPQEKDDDVRARLGAVEVTVRNLQEEVTPLFGSFLM